MKGFVQDVESLTVQHNDFRQVLYTAQNCQLVLMALQPAEEIGAEVHTLDQFFGVEEGTKEISQPIPVATLTIGLQHVESSDGRALAEHRPMAGINRLRRAVYLASQAKRAANGVS